LNRVAFAATEVDAYLFLVNRIKCFACTLLILINLDSWTIRVHLMIGRDHPGTALGIGVPHLLWERRLAYTTRWPGAQPLAARAANALRHDIEVEGLGGSPRTWPTSAASAFWATDWRRRHSPMRGRTCGGNPTYWCEPIWRSEAGIQRDLPKKSHFP
jgi:hypothetical protein